MSKKFTPLTLAIHFLIEWKLFNSSLTKEAQALLQVEGVAELLNQYQKDFDSLESDEEGLTFWAEKADEQLVEQLEKDIMSLLED